MKRTIYLLGAILVLCLAAVGSKTFFTDTNAYVQKQEQLTRINSRFKQIKAIDKTKLTGKQRAVLVNELNALKQQSQEVADNNEVLSAGGSLIAIVAAYFI